MRRAVAYVLSVFLATIALPACAASLDGLAVDVKNESEPVLCAEKDNVAVSFANKDVRSFRIEAAHPVYLADTLGEMALWYRAAGLCFVGGSLAPRGGHTPFEPAAAGSVILHGPSVENFAAPYQALERAGAALAVTGPADLTRALAPLIGDGAGQRRLADAARAALSAFRGQTDEEEFLAALARTTGLVIRAE